MRDTIQPRNVILARGKGDGEAVQAANPRMANWDILTKASEVYGIWVDEWVITELAANGLGLPRYNQMVKYLRRRQELTETLTAQRNPRSN